MSLADPGQPYSCEQWQAVSSADSPLIIDQNQAGNFNSTPYINLYHDSWGGATPTFALIDHTMTIRAKPWTLTNNTNTNQCDGTSNTIDGWSGGNTANFLQQLVDECGTLCEGCSGTVDSDNDGIADECDDCHNMPGDIDDNMENDILDIVQVVNMILSGGMNSLGFNDCELSDGDLDGNGAINILDVILLINLVLG